MKLSSSQAQAHLRRLESELGSTDFSRAASAIGLLDAGTNQVSVAVALAALFPNSRYLDSKNKQLTLLRQRFNGLAEAAALAIRWQATEARSVGAERRHLWFDGEPLLVVAHTTDELVRVAPTLIKNTLGLPLHTEPRITLAERLGDKPVVRWFVSYAHADKLATHLQKTLRTQLGNSKHYHFEEWSDQQILVGQAWHAQIQGALHPRGPCRVRTRLARTGGRQRKRLALAGGADSR